MIIIFIVLALFLLFAISSSFFEGLLGSILDFFKRSSHSSRHSRSSRDTGAEGELAVIRAIGKDIEGKQYSIHNYQVAINDTTMQVDHIVINSCGLFVIETKNYSGTIYGSEESLHWTQYLANGNLENKFYNPIKQNFTHIFNLADILETTELPIYNLVVFVQNNSCRVQSPHIVELKSLKSLINDPYYDANLNSNVIEYIYNKLLEYQRENAVSDEEHLKNIADTQEGIKNNICPRCGGKLVKRNGIYGAFMGCSRYPKCKFKTAD